MSPPRKLPIFCTHILWTAISKVMNFFIVRLKLRKMGRNSGRRLANSRSDANCSGVINTDGADAPDRRDLRDDETFDGRREASTSPSASPPSPSSPSPPKSPPFTPSSPSSPSPPYTSSSSLSPWLKLTFPPSAFP